MAVITVEATKATGASMTVKTSHAQHATRVSAASRTPDAQPFSARAASDAESKGIDLPLDSQRSSAYKHP